MKLTAILLILSLSGILSPAQARLVHAPGNYPLLAQNDERRLEQAIEKIKRKTGGRILSARTVSSNGKTVHVIKVLLPSGQVRIFKVKAR